MPRTPRRTPARETTSSAPQAPTSPPPLVSIANATPAPQPFDDSKNKGPAWHSLAVCVVLLGIAAAIIPILWRRGKAVDSSAFVQSASSQVLQPDDDEPDSLNVTTLSQFEARNREWLVMLSRSASGVEAALSAHSEFRTCASSPTVDAAVEIAVCTISFQRVWDVHFSEANATASSSLSPGVDLWRARSESALAIAQLHTEFYAAWSTQTAAYRQAARTLDALGSALEALNTHARQLDAIDALGDDDHGRNARASERQRLEVLSDAAASAHSEASNNVAAAESNLRAAEARVAKCKNELHGTFLGVQKCSVCVHNGI